MERINELDPDKPGETQAWLKSLKSRRWCATCVKQWSVERFVRPKCFNLPRCASRPLTSLRAYSAIVSFSSHADEQNIFCCLSQAMWCSLSIWHCGER